MFHLQMQLSFQVWTDQIQETLNAKKQGDAAFKGKDFVTTIECYTQVRNTKLVGYFLETLNVSECSLIVICSSLKMGQWYRQRYLQGGVCVI